MTSLVRAKRNSKAPNRFSSDNAQIETSNVNGETIIDYNDNSTSTTHNLLPINRTIKLKPAIREPLKVKLPKLKRPSDANNATTTTSMQSSKSTTKTNSKANDIPKSGSSEVKIHKIKLPSLAARKSSKEANPTSNRSDSHKSSSTTAASAAGHNQPGPASSTHLSSLLMSASNDKPEIDPVATAATKIKLPKFNKASLLQSNNTTGNNSPSLLVKIVKQSSDNAKATSPDNNHSIDNYNDAATNNDLNVSNSSVSTNEGDISSIANSSSDDTANESKMEIVVSQQKPDAAANSGIRCPCGVDDDLGVMVECENCSTWQHGHCINVGTEDDAYEGYTCGFCSSPQTEGAHNSLLDLTVGDKFQSRFEQLESLRKQAKSSNYNNQQQQDVTLTAENNAHLTIDELSQAIKDLNRVLNSLRVKWRLLTSQAYEAELRIWQNSYWSDECNSDKDKNFYFMDRCKSNLKLNIRNMIKKMEKRCRVIGFAISMIEAKDGSKSTGSSNSINEILHQSKLKQMRSLLNSIRDDVGNFNDKMKTLSSQ